MEESRREQLEKKYAKAPKNIRAFVLGTGLPRQGLITGGEQLNKNVMSVINWLNKKNGETG